MPPPAVTASAIHAGAESGATAIRGAVLLGMVATGYWLAQFAVRVAATSPAESPPRRNTNATNPRETRVSTSINVAAAPMSGLITDRTAEKTYTGRVVDPAVLTNVETMVLSRLNVKANSAPREVRGTSTAT